MPILASIIHGAWQEITEKLEWAMVYLSKTAKRVGRENPSVALLLEAPIPDFPKAVEEHRPGQRVARLTFVQAGMHAAAQFNTLQPVQDEQRALDPAQLAQGHGQSVLARVAAELAQHQRGGDGAPV